jgi:hypothetical protein
MLLPSGAYCGVASKERPADKNLAIMPVSQPVLNPVWVDGIRQGLSPTAVDMYISFGVGARDHVSPKSFTKRFWDPQYADYLTAICGGVMLLRDRE